VRACVCVYVCAYVCMCDVRAFMVCQCFRCGDTVYANLAKSGYSTFEWRNQFSTAKKMPDKVQNLRSAVAVYTRLSTPTRVDSNHLASQHTRSSEPCNTIADQGTFSCSLMVTILTRMLAAMCQNKLASARRSRRTTQLDKGNLPNALQISRARFTSGRKTTRLQDSGCLRFMICG